MPHLPEKLTLRFAELARQAEPLREGDRGDGFGEVPSQPFYAWAVSAQSAIQAAFGRTSPHYQSFDRELQALSNKTVYQQRLEAVRGIFLAAKADVDGGHLYNIQRTTAGEVVGDFVGLAKLALSEGHHTVAAVLASAALEDALKRFAAENDLDVSDKTMEDVVNSLKSKGLVSGPQKALLAAMPKLRNKAMHAQWDSITPQDVGSIIGYVEQFLLTHFQ
jgi:hypothetical protein